MRRGFCALIVLLSACDMPLVDQAAANRAKEYIRNQLRDPSSAEFRNIEILTNCIIGEVNGKNAFGGYVGFSKFYFDPFTGGGRIDPGLPDSLSPEAMGPFEQDQIKAKIAYDTGYMACMKAPFDNTSAEQSDTQAARPDI